MNTDLDKKLEKLLWSDLSSGNFHTGPSRLLAHYTSIDTLEKIIQSNELWFSNPLHMNDLNELWFGMQEGAKAFRVHTGLMKSVTMVEQHVDLLKHFDGLFAKFDREHVFDTYIFCVSEHDQNDNDGALSMWRGYGASGAGVAIVFDLAKIERTGQSPLIIDKVDYMKPGAQQQWMINRLDEICELICDRTLNDRDLFSIAHYWLERLKIFSLFTKHIGFVEENEWRAVYLKDRDPAGSLVDMFSYAVTNGGVEPKLKLKIAPLPGIFAKDLSLGEIVAKIILGPSHSSVLARLAVIRMLEKNGEHDLATRVVASSIPFRPKS